MERWKTAEARSKTAGAASAWAYRSLDLLKNLKGSLYYHIRGEGSLRDEGPRPPGARQPQVPRFTSHERRELENFEREVTKMESALKQFARDGRKADEILG